MKLDVGSAIKLKGRRWAVASIDERCDADGQSLSLTLAPIEVSQEDQTLFDTLPSVSIGQSTYYEGEPFVVSWYRVSHDTEDRRGAEILLVDPLLVTILRDEVIGRRRQMANTQRIMPKVEKVLDNTQ